MSIAAPILQSVSTPSSMAETEREEDVVHVSNISDANVTATMPPEMVFGEAQVRRKKYTEEM